MKLQNEKDLKAVMRKPVSEAFFQKSVKTVSPSTSLYQVLQTLKKNNIGSLVILKGGKIEGIFTERDFIQKVAGNNFDLQQLKVASFMTQDPVCITAEVTVGEALLKMQVGGFRHLVVVDKHQLPLNVISIKDVLAYMVETFIDHLVSENQAA